jgi:hypothetical protein
MPSAAALATAHARDRSARHSTYGSPIRIADENGTGIYPPPRYNPTLPEGGLVSDYSTTLRIKKVDWPAYTKQSDFWTVQVQILQAPDDWLTLRVTACQDMNLTGEWKLTLEALP